MSVFYADTSAIAKHYIAEVGSAWIQSLVNSTTNRFVVSELTIVEFVSVLARRQREGHLSMTDASNYEIQYLADYKNRYDPVPADSDVIIAARQLLYRHTLRALDAIHLASALKTIQVTGLSVIFLTSDKHLLSAAAGEGLPTDNPLNHP